MYEEEENRWRCSFRSDGKWINVNELLQAFCGGGHAAAAGVRKRTNDVDKFRPEILAVSYTHLTLPTKRIV